jgi:hypothetical protein
VELFIALCLKYSNYCSIYTVASKCSWNHFSSQNYKAVKSSKLRFLQNSTLVPIYLSASDCKGVGNIPGKHFMKAFSVLPSHY